MNSSNYIESFNQSLKLISRDLNKRYPNDAILSRVHKRISTIISISPSTAIKTIGPHLYTYKDQIYNLDAKASNFFLSDLFDTDLKKAVNGKEIDMVSYLIPKVKEYARVIPEEDREVYKNLIIDMLDNYVEYITLINSM